MPNVQQTTINNSTIIFDAQIFAAPDVAIFDSQYWQTRDQISGTATGRGTTYFFWHNGQELVLRHYRRGGLIGKVINDQYLFKSLEETRAWQEFRLLAHMQKLALPAPAPVAAKVTRHGPVYRADIIIKRIGDSQDVFTLLCRCALAQHTWQAIGACIRQFHNHDIYHHDLNIHNIMLDKQQKVWLIDFDKCTVKPCESYKAANLARLKRSLYKEHSKQPHFNFNEANWQTLLAGYTGK
jgi:3-deoxy-D-manno-octulosonic acid kinase